MISTSVSDSVGITRTPTPIPPYPFFIAFLNTPTGACNRIRATKIDSKRFAASWSELGKVFIYDLSKPWNALAGGEAGLKDYNSQRLDARIKPCASFKGHLTEGFAMDWSTMVPGKLITGDCKGDIEFVIATI